MSSINDKEIADTVAQVEAETAVQEAGEAVAELQAEAETAAQEVETAASEQQVEAAASEQQAEAESTAQEVETAASEQKEEAEAAAQETEEAVAEQQETAESAVQEAENTIAEMKEEAEDVAAEQQAEAETAIQEAEDAAVELQAEAESVAQDAENVASEQQAEAESAAQEAEATVAEQQEEAGSTAQEVEIAVSEQQAEAESAAQETEIAASEQKEEAEAAARETEAAASELQAEAEAVAQEAEAVVQEAEDIVAAVQEAADTAAAQEAADAAAAQEEEGDTGMQKDTEDREVQETTAGAAQEAGNDAPAEAAAEVQETAPKTTRRRTRKTAAKTAEKKPAEKKPAAKPGRKPTRRTARSRAAAAEAAEPVVELNQEVIRKKSWKYLVDENSVSDERLDRIALISMDRKYTYRQMFRIWERYAEVFSALDITAENHSRLAIFDCTAVESSFAIYAANMTGASIAGLSPYTISDKYPLDKVIQTEKITDLFINDLVINKDMLLHILKKKEELELRNIIVVRVPLENENMEPELIKMSNDNYRQLKQVQGALFMDDLLEEYEATPIKYGPDVFEKDAFILHTSGTTKGISKPSPLSDVALNAAAESLKASGKVKQFEDGAVSMCFMVATSVYGLVDQLHAPLAFGCSVLVPPMATSNPFALKAIEYYKVNVLFITPFYFEIWAKMPPECLPYFSSVKLIVFGGSYLSAEARKRYDEIVKSRNGNAEFINGYGMSETGGACIVQTDDVEDDSIGLPLPGVRIKIFDENDEKFYSMADGHTGVLYIHSDSISEGMIGDLSFFETETIDGVPYICTNDVVGINKDGSLRWQGRANRFFVNNEGIKFNAGLVETQVAAEPGIEACAVVPWFDKIITHDTVPVLYVQTVEKGKDAVTVVRDALINMFINHGKAEETNLPVQCVMVDQIPHNVNGKVDIYQITEGGVTGDRYVIRPKREDGVLKDIVLEYDADQSNSVGNGAIPDELSQIVESVKSTTADETVLNAAGRIANSKIMLEVFTKGQMAMYQRPLEMATQFINTAISRGAQLWNGLLQMMDDRTRQQLQSMPPLPYLTQQHAVPQQDGAAPQGEQTQSMPPLPYLAQPQSMPQQTIPQMPYAPLFTPPGKE